MIITRKKVSIKTGLIWRSFLYFASRYENGNADRPHKEPWHQSHIWSMTETCFDRLETIEAVSGESVALYSRKRTDSQRAISSISKVPRSKHGDKCDLIFRQYDNHHTCSLEFGASETKSNIEHESGTNFMKEGFYKLSRTLKDIFDCLLEGIDFDDRSTRIRAVRFLQSGLSSTLIQLDRPTRRASCISRCRTLENSGSDNQSLDLLNNMSIYIHGFAVK